MSTLALLFALTLIFIA